MYGNKLSKLPIIIAMSIAKLLIIIAIIIAKLPIIIAFFITFCNKNELYAIDKVIV